MVTDKIHAGSWKIQDPNPILVGKTVTREAPYRGVIVLRMNAGRGYFSLPQLPSLTQPSALKTAILSGPVEVLALP
jgi:hypothetical protein